MGAEKLKILRKNLGLNQSDVAEKCGVVPSTVSKWELGQLDIPTTKVEALADTLGVAVDVIDEIRSESDVETNGDVVCSRMDAYRWLLSIASSGEPVETRAILSGLPLFADPKTWMVLVSVDQFADRAGLVHGFVVDHWDAAISTPFVERVNPAVEYAFRLKLVE